MLCGEGANVLMLAVGSLDRNVANVNQMLQEMRVIAVNKDHTLSK